MIFLGYFHSTVICLDKNYSGVTRLQHFPWNWTCRLWTKAKRSTCINRLFVSILTNFWKNRGYFRKFFEDFTKVKLAKAGSGSLLRIYSTTENFGRQVQSVHCFWVIHSKIIRAKTVPVHELMALRLSRTLSNRIKLAVSSHSFFFIFRGRKSLNKNSWAEILYFKYIKGNVATCG